MPFDDSAHATYAARLIPTSGIKGADEQERRAASALLAVLQAVQEFGRSVVSRLGAPAGTIKAYIEVPFVLGEKTIRPDGIIRVTRGQRSWTALVEVKTESNPLESTQLNDYLDLARAEDFDALLTVSNEIPAIPGQHPTAVDKKKIRQLVLHHLSWTELLTEAVVQKSHRGVSDPDQAWILGELIRYLEHPRSGALGFEDMGSSWVPVREGVIAGTLRPTDKAVAEVANRWDQLLRFVCLDLGKKLGTEVQPGLSRKELADPLGRVQALATALTNTGILEGAIRIPNTVGSVTLRADLRASRVSCSVDIDAPREGRPLTRANWIIRQLAAAPSDIRLDVFVQGTRAVAKSSLLSAARENSALLIDDSKRDTKSYRLTLSVPMGSKRGIGRGSFIHSVLDVVNAFYEGVLEKLRPWAPPPRKLREEEPANELEPGVPEELVSTALSSQDAHPQAETQVQADDLSQPSA